MLTRIWFATALVFVAAPLPAAEPAKPTLEVRTRSVDDLLTAFEFLAAIDNKDDSVKQLREFVKSQSTSKDGFEGFDTARPIGLYATLTADVADSPVVMMVPVVSEERVLKGLKDRLDITPEKTPTGAYKVNVPLLNEPLFVRFADGYAYVATRAGDAAERLTPKAFFPAGGPVAAARLRLDRVPDDIKKVVLGQFELKVADERKKAEPNETPAQKQLKDLFFDGILSAANAVAADGRELAFNFAVDPAADDVSAELTLSARDGSPLAAALADAGKRTSLPLGLVGGGPAAVRLSYCLAFPAAYRKRYAAAVDAALADGVKAGGDSPAAKRVADTVAPTLKANRFEGATAVTGPDADGRYRLIAALGVADGKEIEKLVKDFSAFLPASVGAFAFDAATAGPFAVHTFDVKAAPPEAKEMFGTRTARLGTSADALVVALGPDADAFAAALKAKPTPAPIVSVDVAMARLLPLSERGLKPDERKAVLHDAFGDGPADGKDTIRFVVTGGDRLTARLTAKSKALRVAAAVNQLKKN